MRLAIVNHHGRKPAGAEHSLLLLVEQLPPEIEPVFFLFEEGGFTEELRSRYKSVTIVPMSERVANATREHLPLNAIADSLRLTWTLSQAFRRAKIDIVLTNSMKAHIIGGLAARLAGKRCVNFLHDIPVGAARLLIREVSRYCAADRLTCSDAVGKNLALDSTTVVYSPIELSKYQNLPPQSEARSRLGLPVDDLPVIGLVGRIARWKGQDRFIRVAAKIRDRGINAHFAIIGSAIFGCDPAYVGELHDLVRELGLESRVHFVPWQSDMTVVYGAMSVTCNCSSREPFARTSIESLACGIPIVCFDDAGVCEVFEDGIAGAKVPAGDLDAFVDALAGFLVEPARRVAAREPAKRSVAEMDVAHIAERFVAVIQRHRSLLLPASLTPALASAEGTD